MKSLRDYTVVVSPDDNGTFVAYVPAIRGCHAWGLTPEEAQAELINVFEMIEEESNELSTKEPANSTCTFKDDRATKKLANPGKAIDITCPRCKRDCIFQWKDFKNGTRHIEQRCPHHGYVKYALKVEPYLTLANKAKEGSVQKKLF